VTFMVVTVAVSWIVFFLFRFPTPLCGSSFMRARRVCHDPARC
jgi:hypothetical protein